MKAWFSNFFHSNMKSSLPRMTLLSGLVFIGAVLAGLLGIIPSGDREVWIIGAAIPFVAIMIIWAAYKLIFRK